MSILGLDHAGVTVANLDRSLAFYEGLLADQWTSEKPCSDRADDDVMADGCTMDL